MAKPSPWDDLNRPAAALQANRGRAAALVAPELFAHVPADSPYVFAGFEAVPQGFWSRVCDQVCPLLESVLGVPSERLKDHDGRVFSAIFGAFNGKLSSAGLTGLGFATNARWVLYGLGLQPVLRVEVYSPAAVEATLDAIAQAAGLTLEQRTVGSTQYRYGLITELAAIAVGIVDRQLVLVWGEPLSLTEPIEKLFSGAKPAANMQTGAVLRKLSTDYGFAGYGLGYVDLVRAIELYSASDSPSCKTARARIGEVLPRIVFGYDKLTEQRLAGSVIFETGEVEKLRRIQVPLPGFTTRVPQAALIAAGLAVDRAQLQSLGQALVPWGLYYRLSCGALPISVPGFLKDAAGGDTSDALALLPSEVVSEVRGGSVVLMSADTSSAIPQALAGYGILGVGDANRVLAALASLLARGGVRGAVADGVFHGLQLGDLSTFVKTPAGISGHQGAIVFAAGSRARATIAAGLRDRSVIARPLAMLGLDLSKVNRPLHRFLPLPTAVDGGSLEPTLMRSIHRVAESLIGFAVTTLLVSDRGLELVFRIDLR